MKYTTIENNKAAHVLRVDPFSVLNEGYAATFVECPDEVEQGWILTDGVWSEPPPYVPTPEDIRNAAKAQREAAVAAIKVTTAAGNTFDGDETSQTRMTRAITALMAVGGTVNWVLADNTVIQADAAELTEALALSGAAQAALWVI